MPTETGGTFSQGERTGDIEIEIEAVGDQPEPKTVEVDPPEPKRERKRKDPDEGIKALQKQLEDERRERENERTLRLAAEQNAREAAESEVRARTDAQGSQLDLIKNAHASLTSAQGVLKARLADAMTSQDFAAAADIQLEMTNNAARLSSLENHRIQLEKQPKPQVRQPVDPLDRVTKEMSPQSAAWVRAHPDFARDPAKYRRMVAAHELAVTDGLVEDTPEYFKHIEGTLKISAPETDQSPADDPMRDTARAPPRRAAPPAAPVTRSGNGAGPRTDVITLSPDEVEMAELSDMKPEEWAKQKQRIARDKAAGRIN